MVPNSSASENVPEEDGAGERVMAALPGFVPPTAVVAVTVTVCWPETVDGGV